MNKSSGKALLVKTGPGVHPLTFSPGPNKPQQVNGVQTSMKSLKPKKYSVPSTGTVAKIGH